MQRVIAYMCGKDFTGRETNMFFLIKSAFWLCVVFSCMTWPQQETPQTIARQAAGELASRAQAIVVEKATDLCAANPRQCMASVQRAAVLAEPPGPPPRPPRARSVN